MIPASGRVGCIEGSGHSTYLAGAVGYTASGSQSSIKPVNGVSFPTKGQHATSQLPSTRLRSPAPLSPCSTARPVHHHPLFHILARYQLTLAMSSEPQQPRDPQTTPFVQPSICAELFTTTTVLAYPDSDGHHPTIEALVQDASDPRYPSCQPPGWAAKPTHYQYWFSPAVCPSGWTAYSLRKLDPVTHAYCCSR
jgi:hypothetical protein